MLKIFMQKLRGYEDNYLVDETIDAVYTYVSPHDEKWRNKYEKYQGKSIPKARYSDSGELRFSIRTLKRFCPFINRIFIVTDDQRISWCEDDSQITIVDHSEILSDECIRPTFKSASIEAYLHKIPDLSECFMYLNDDTFIGRHIERRLIVENKQPIAYLEHKCEKFIKALREEIDQAIVINNTMRCVEKKFGVILEKLPIHQVVTIRKSCCELAWEFFRKELEKSVRTRTRTPPTNTIHFILLTQYIGVLMGYLKFKPMSNIETTLIATGDENREAWLNEIIQEKPHFFCINSIITKDSQRLFSEFVAKFDKNQI